MPKSKHFENTILYNQKNDDKEEMSMRRFVKRAILFFSCVAVVLSARTMSVGAALNGDGYDSAHQSKESYYYYFKAVFHKNGSNVTGTMKSYDMCTKRNSMFDRMYGDTDWCRKYDIAFQKNQYQRTGYVFSGWNTKKDGTGAMFKDMESVEELAYSDRLKTLKKAIKKENGVPTIHFYAQWVKRLDKSAPTINTMQLVKGTKKNKYGEYNKSIIVKINRKSGYSGYEIRCANNPYFCSAKKIILNKNKRKVNFENVCFGCCGDYGMYVKVRGFKTDSKGKKAYSTWSKVKKVKVKRSKKSTAFPIFHYKDRKGVKKVGYCFWNDTDSRYETIYGPAINI